MNNYITLCQQLFQTIRTNPNRESIAPLLKANQELLTQEFLTYLRDYISHLLQNPNSIETSLLAQDTRNIGIIFQDLSDANPHLYIEIALTCHQQALTILTSQLNPVEWAKTQIELGNAYYNQINTDRKTNLENAIKCYNKALKVFTSSSNYLKLWGTLQKDLGLAYTYRIVGETKDNLEKAISYYQEALRVFTKNQYPQIWANIWSYLGIIFWNRIEGNKEENLEKAIACIEQQALSILNPTDHPIDWAQAQHFLGISYRNRKKGNPDQNIKQAIACYQQALTKYNPIEHQIDWALLQMNIGIAYREIPQSPHPEENIKTAINNLREAEAILTKEKYPEYWAKIQYNLGITYQKKTAIDNSSDLEIAIEYYHKALTIYTPSQIPLECLRTARNLGDLAFTQGNWKLAFKSYSTAIEAVEQNRSWTTTEQERHRILEESLEVFAKQIQTCINLDDIPTAIQYVEKSRAQKLVDLIAAPDLYSDAKVPELIKKYLKEYYQTQDELNQIKHKNFLSTENGKSIALNNRDLTTLNQEKELIKKLENKLETLWDNIIILDRETAANLKNSAPDLSAIQQLIPNSHTAILSFYTTQDKTYIFIIHQNRIACHETQITDHQPLQDQIKDHWLTPYNNERDNNKTQWIEQIPNFLHKLSSQLKLPELIDQHLTNITELILIPHLYFHFIPLSSLPLNPDPKSHKLGEILLDKFVIRYIPSCQVLQFCQNRDPITTAIYGTAENANDDLLASQLEGEHIAQLYQIPLQNRLIGKANATVANYHSLLQQVNIMLSTHHASYNIDNPLQSILALSDGVITLSEIILSKYPHLDEIILNNCETGISQITSLTDDPLSLAFGFLRSGARTVISTLWSVDDLASAILSILYHQHKLTMRKPEALRLAQQEVRNMTMAKLNQILPNFIQQYQNLLEDKFKEIYYLIKKAASQQEKQLLKQQYEKLLNQKNEVKQFLNVSSDTLLFADPFYWSGFIYFGLG